MALIIIIIMEELINGKRESYYMIKKKQIYNTWQCDNEKQDITYMHKQLYTYTIILYLN